MDDALPYSQASENNKHVIADILRRHLGSSQIESLLEIAGGTGQHAVHFAEQFPAIHWQSSDIPANVDTLNKRVAAAELTNLPLALELDVNQHSWRCPPSHAIFSANSLHIMSAASVENFFKGIASHQGECRLLMVYGPFRYEGEFTTPSNARFDTWLKDRDALSGVRDFEWVNELATDIGFELAEDNAMPANNQLLVWKRP